MDVQVSFKGVMANSGVPKLDVQARLEQLLLAKQSELRRLGEQYSACAERLAKLQYNYDMVKTRLEVLKATTAHCIATEDELAKRVGEEKRAVEEVQKELMELERTRNEFHCAVSNDSANSLAKLCDLIEFYGRRQLSESSLMDEQKAVKDEVEGLQEEHDRLNMELTHWQKKFEYSMQVRKSLPSPMVVDIVLKKLRMENQALAVHAVHCRRQAKR